MAWHGLGWKAIGYSEIEPFPMAVLKHHYPNVFNFGDITKFKEWDNERIGPIDVLAGGTPCQSFSVAGKRQGLDDERGRIMFSYIGIVERFRPQWIVWENVPGVLSSNRGRDFGTLLGALGQLGYECSFRVLNAQWFGVAQSRRRVFVVGYLGNRGYSGKVLFESESVCRNNPAGKTARQNFANRIATGTGTNPELMATLCALDNSKWGCNQWIDEGKAIVVHETQNPCVSNIAFDQERNNESENVICLMDQGGNSMDIQNNLTGTLRRETHGNNPIIAQKMKLRRLTPRECERLQGFPDDYTMIPWKKRLADQCPDGPRYKALGNSMAVPVMKWIGERINKLKNI